MAFLRLFRLWRRRAPIDPATAHFLRRLLMWQLLVFFVMLVLWIATRKFEPLKDTANYFIGAGVGWLLLIRYYVWQYVE